MRSDKWRLRINVGTRVVRAWILQTYAGEHLSATRKLTFDVWSGCYPVRPEELPWSQRLH